MPRKKYDFLPGKEKETVNCFAFIRTAKGTPACRALADIYCLKEETPCSFYAPPEKVPAPERKPKAES